MRTFVLDASVAVKWAMPSASEPLTEESLRLLRRYTGGEIDFLVPDIFWAEVGNVLWKGIRQRRWRQTEAEAFLSGVKARNFPTTSSWTLLSDALTIAVAYDRAVYDSLYVALAIQAKTDLITADERLVKIQELLETDQRELRVYISQLRPVGGSGDPMPSLPTRLATLASSGLQHIHLNSAFGQKFGDVSVSQRNRR